MWIFPAFRINDFIWRFFHSGSASVHDLQLSQLYPRQDFRRLSEIQPLFDFCFSKREGLKFQDTKTLQVTPRKAGRCDAVFMWWDLKMDPEGECILTCAPNWAQTGTTNSTPADASDVVRPLQDRLPWRDHWMQAVYHLTPQLKIHPGSAFSLHAVHDEYSFNFSVSHDPAMNTDHLKHLVCTCYSHIVMNRSRMAMLSNIARVKFWARTLQKVGKKQTKK